MSTRTRLVIVVIGLLLCWSQAPARAQQVLWGSPVGVPSCTSEGLAHALDDSFTFQVGAFFDAGSPGWTPAPGNAVDWADHWIAADSAVYDEKFRTFTGSCVVDTLFAGKQGYIWGFNDRTVNGQWILMTDPSWIFPGPNAAGLSFPASWQTSSATVVIVGSVHPSSVSSVHLKTAQVSESPMPYVPREQWLGMYFNESELADALVTAWISDPDRDGLTNLAELAVGGSPLRADKQPYSEIGIMGMGGERYLTLTVRRAPNVNVIYEAEVSSNLADWDSGEGAVSVLSETASEIRFRDNTPLRSEMQRFIRLHVSSP